VTKFVLKSHPQTDITVSRRQSFSDYTVYVLKPWQGGILIYSGDKQDQIKEALVKFQGNGDPKATVMIGLTYGSGMVCSVV
jgi:hypothetical protein